MTKSVTAAQVAAHAGVSRAVVSSVLNGKAADRRIAPATQERVLNAARELGYQLPFYASALRSGRARCIGWLPLGPRCVHHQRLHAALAMACQQRDQLLMLAGAMMDSPLLQASGPDLIPITAALAECTSARFDGLVTYAITIEAILLDNLRVLERHKRTPVVVISTQACAAPALIRLDVERAWQQALLACSRHGHRRLGVNAPSGPLCQWRNWSSPQGIDTTSEAMQDNVSGLILGDHQMLAHALRLRSSTPNNLSLIACAEKDDCQWMDGVDLIDCRWDSLASRAISVLCDMIDGQTGARQLVHHARYEEHGGLTVAGANS